MNETLQMVIEALHGAMGDGRYTTRQLEEMLDSFFGYRCPDDLSRSLNKLRLTGLICGEVDREQACWVWWFEKEGKDQSE